MFNLEKKLSGKKYILMITLGNFEMVPPTMLLLLQIWIKKIIKLKNIKTNNHANLEVESCVYCQLYIFLKTVHYRHTIVLKTHLK